MSDDLDLPFPYSMPHGDVILRTALVAAFDDVRANPWLLDFCFAYFKADLLTTKVYGQKELDRCKAWFLENDVKITAGTNVQTLEIPHIAIWPGGQNEAEATLGDINEDAQITVKWPTPPKAVLSFTAAAYDSTTGIVTLPDSVDLTTVFVGDLVYDRKSGKSYAISDIEENAVTIAAGSTPNLTNAQIQRPTAGTMIVALESISTQDNYQIDIIVPGDATACIILHTITVFCLNRYKESLLEGRGYERTSITSTGINGVKGGGQSTQLMFQRGISVSGYIRSFWPKEIGQPVAGIVPSYKVDGGLEVGADEMDALGSRLWTSVADTSAEESSDE